MGASHNVLLQRTDLRVIGMPIINLVVVDTGVKIWRDDDLDEENAYALGYLLT